MEQRAQGLFDRRRMIGAGAAAGAAVAAPGQLGPGVPVRHFGSLATLRAAGKLEPGALTYLDDPARGGLFVVRTGSSPVDALEGLFVRTVAADRYLERLWDGVHGRPEWFGAHVDTPSVDCADALEACLGACPVTILSAADYYLRRTLRLAQSGRAMRGIGIHVTARRLGTRLILAKDAPGAATDDIVSVGATVGGASADGLVGELHLANFTVLREAPPRAHPSGDSALCPTGIRMSRLSGSSVKGVASLESSVGFGIGGVVYCKVDDCVAFRTVAGAAGIADRWVGYFLDGRRNIGFSGGNASIYLNRCIAVGQPPAAVEPTALRAEGAFVDTFLDHFESARIDSGIVFHASGARAVGQTVDVHIRAAVIDGCVGRGIDINLDATSSASIEIIDPYVYAAGGGAEHGIAVHDGAGLTTITGGQLHGDFRGGSLSLSRTRGVRAQGIKIQQALRPVVVTAADALHLEPQISNAGKWTGMAAIQCDNVGRSTIRPTVMAAAGHAFAGGLALDARCHHLSIDTSSVDPAALRNGSTTKVLFVGVDARGAAAFRAAGNVLSGVID